MFVPSYWDKLAGPQHFLLLKGHCAACRSRWSGGACVRLSELLVCLNIWYVFCCLFFLIGQINIYFFCLHPCVLLVVHHFDLVSPDLIFCGEATSPLHNHPQCIGGDILQQGWWGPHFFVNNNKVPQERGNVCIRGRIWWDN